MIVPGTIPGTVELALSAARTYGHPNWEVELEACFTASDCEEFRQPGFLAAPGRWTVRFRPPRAGRWRWRSTSLAGDAGLDRAGEFDAPAPVGPGLLRADPAAPWGFRDDGGGAPFLLGDTLYNLFAAAHAGLDWEAVVGHRLAQGFNLFRCRVVVSPFHPHTPYSEWMGRGAWAWGGSPQCPDYATFAPAYWATVERVLGRLQELGARVELILEAWLFEAPFNQRAQFLPEHEELFFRETVARLGAFASVGLWCVANEYNLYTHPDPLHPLSARYARRLGRLLRQADGHRHPIATHVTAAERMTKPFKEHFRHAPEIDVLLMQYWGESRDDAEAALCPGIEEELARSALDGGKSVIFSEYGYERPAEGAADFPAFHRFGPDHTRRGALRALFAGVPVCAGFDNTWGPHFTLRGDPPGAAQFVHLRRLFTELADFRQLRPAPELLDPAAAAALPPGHRPSALAGPERRSLLVYAPTGAPVALLLPPAAAPREARWFNPADGSVRPTEPPPAGGGAWTAVPPVDGTEAGADRVWVAGVAG